MRIFEALSQLKILLIVEVVIECLYFSDLQFQTSLIFMTIPTVKLIKQKLIDVSTKKRLAYYFSAAVKIFNKAQALSPKSTHNYMIF